MRPRIKTKDPLTKGAGGRNLCRWCSKEVGKGRRTVCSPECVHEYLLRSRPAYVREKLFERDAGVCAICTLNVETLREVALEINRAYPYYLRVPEFTEARHKVLRASNVPERYWHLRGRLSWWAADHIVPVVEGGGGCGLEGYRTLCTPCHAEETAKLRKRMAAKKRDVRVETLSNETPAPNQGSRPETQETGKFDHQGGGFACPGEHVSTDTGEQL